MLVRENMPALLPLYSRSMPVPSHSTATSSTHIKLVRSEQYLSPLESRSTHVRHLSRTPVTIVFIICSQSPSQALDGSRCI